jgi:hypothetical protein
MPLPPFPARPDAGRARPRIFFDSRLSEPRGMSCASCHDPARVFATLPAGSPGVPQGSRPGHFSLRNAPSLLYVRYVPRRHFYQDDDAPAPAPFGGLFADGRADTLAEQIRGPLLDPNEMNNGAGAAAAQGSTAPNWPALAASSARGARDPEAMVRRSGRRWRLICRATRWRRSRRASTLPAPPHAAGCAEMRGLALFKNPDKGNCMSCHTLSDTAAGRSARCSPTSATTRSPCRATALPANRDPAFRQRPVRHRAHAALARADQWCGYLRTPGCATWRSPALHAQRRVHDAARRRRVLQHALDRSAFWYHGARTFDDVPAAYRDNINVNSTP